MMNIAMAQTIASENLEANLHKMEEVIRTAKSDGADLVVFPEMAYFSAKSQSKNLPSKPPTKFQWPAVTQQYDIILGNFCALARSLNIAIIPGTLREPISDSTKCFNTLPFIDETGKILAEYRKIFLYKADLPDRSYDESSYCEAGSKQSTFQWKDHTIGLGICFDLRFPEFFRALKKQGAEVVFLPSAFTVPTGKAHWHTLVRARAIENQFFILAPGLTGKSGDGSEKYGHSLAFDPWGQPIAEMTDQVQVSLVPIEKSAILKAQNLVNAWACRREDLFPI